MTPRQLLQENGTPYAQLHLGDVHWTDEDLVYQMLKSPIIINRPIVITPWGTKLFRPNQSLVPKALIPSCESIHP